MANCTTLDHIYPAKKFGTKCLCGKRAWGKADQKPVVAQSKSQLKRLQTQGVKAVLVPAADVDPTDLRAESHVEKTLASENVSDVGSTTNEDSQSQEAIHILEAADINQTERKTSMSVTLTLKGLSKSGKYALYKGLRTVTRISVTNFPESKPSESFTAEGNFAGPREKKPPMTAEERKAARANKPKLTLAQKIEKQAAALAKLQAKAAAGESAPA